MKEVNEPLSFSECGIDEETYMRNVPDIANKAFKDKCTTANPKLPLVKEIEQIDKHYLKCKLICWQYIGNRYIIDFGI